MTKLRNKTKSILIVSPYPEGVAPGQRLKYEQYFDYLRSHGYEITVTSFVSSRLWSILYKKGRFPEKIFWTLLGFFKRLVWSAYVPFYDGIFVFHSVSLFGPALFERLYARLNPKMIYDIDDMIHLSHSSQANSFTKWLKGSSRITYLMRRARHIITCTPALDKFARQFNHNTTDISSTINTDTYQPVNTYTTAAGTPITLGWSGSHSTEKYLSLLGDVLREVARQRNIRLLVIGSGNFTMPGVPVESIAWNRDSEVVDLQRIDIGLYPLPDDPWVYGKSGLKALQYMALGIPTIATGIGTNFRVIDHDRCGLLVKSDQEWIAALLLLIDHPEKRRSLGTAGRERIETYYSIKANQEVYLAIFDKVYGAPKGWPRPSGLSIHTRLETETSTAITVPI
jgi:glycosyltransferase involved in cell wall biosynthesis